MKNSKTGLAVAYLSVEKASLHSSLFIKERDVDRKFARSLGNVTLISDRLALLLNKILISLWLSPHQLQEYMIPTSAQISIRGVLVRYKIYKLSKIYSLF